MAEKWTEKNTASAPALTDLILQVTDPGGTPASEKTLYNTLPFLQHLGSCAQYTIPVTNDTNGKVMIKTNVVIDGTTMGASTDVEGFYFIINENRVTIPINFRLNVYESTL